MSEQEKKRQKIDNLLNAETKSKLLCRPYTSQKITLIEKEWRIKQTKKTKQNEKKVLNCSRLSDEGPPLRQ